MDNQKQKQPFYKQWWFIILIVCLGLIIVGSLAPNEPKQKTKKEVVNNQNIEIIDNKDSTKLDEEKSKLNYQIVYEIDDIRYDGGKNYYVLIDRVDLSNPEFKDKIKRMIDEIVELKGEKISVDFLDNNDYLDLYYKSQYGKMTLGRILTKDEQEKIGLSLIASYSGQLSTEIYLNSLAFFPGAFTDNPLVGKYVESVEYNPSK